MGVGIVSLLLFCYDVPDFIDVVFFLKQTGKELIMKKAELIAAIAEKSDLSKAAAERAVTAFQDTVTESLKNGDSVPLTGFGTFTVNARPGREGRNPQTGATIQIEAKNVPGFKPGKALKLACNQ